MNKWIFAIALFVLSFNAFALTLKEAKNQGLVGERNDGYVGYVTSERKPELVTLVKSVNNKRREKFAATSAKTGATMKQVESTFYQRAVSATAVGNYFQNPQGQWIKK